MADYVLLDTDVFSFLLKGAEASRLAELYLPHVRDRRPVITFVTVGEIYAGAHKKKWNAATLARVVSRMRATVIVPYDEEICKRYGSLVGLKTATGSDRVIAANDRWIAACALHHDIPLITHNRKHFEGIPGLRVISEAPKPAQPAAQPLPLEPPPPPATRH